jgi:hydroxypyruvate reductase
LPHASGKLPAAHLPAPPRNGRAVLLAAGKAAGSMIEVAEKHYLDDAKFPAERVSGIAVARHGYGRPTRLVPMIEAGHPVPDAAGLESAARALKLAEGATKDDLVLVLMSGGASANWIAPAGITFAEKQVVTRALLRSGANIGEKTRSASISHTYQRRAGSRARLSPAQDVTRAVSRRAGRRSRRDRLGARTVGRIPRRCGRARDRGALQARPARDGRPCASPIPANEKPGARRS